MNKLKVVDLLAPYRHGGKIGLFGGARIGKIVLIMELINNMLKPMVVYLYLVGLENVPVKEMIFTWR